MDGEIDRLARWIVDAGGAVGSVAIRGVPGGRSAHATRDIQQDELLLRVPEARTITAASAARDGPARLVERVWAGSAGPQLVLSAFLLQAETDPEWAPYVATLPRELGAHPLFWDDVSDLAGSLFLDLLEARRRVIRQEHAFLRGAVPAFADLAWTDWLRARSLVCSRTFSVDAVGTEALVPYADLFDHDLEGGVRWCMDETTFELRASRPIPRGAPLNICYGQKQNVWLFLYYGFVLAHNPLEGIVVDLGANGRYVVAANDESLEMKAMLWAIDPDVEVAIARFAVTCQDRLSRLPLCPVQADARVICEEEHRILSWWVERAGGL